MSTKYNSILFIGDSIFGNTFTTSNFIDNFQTQNPLVTIERVQQDGTSYGHPSTGDSYLSNLQASNVNPAEAVVIGTGINALNPMGSLTLTSPIEVADTISRVDELVGSIYDIMPFTDIYFMRPLPLNASPEVLTWYLTTEEVLYKSLDNLNKVVEYQSVNFPIINVGDILGTIGSVDPSLYMADKLHPNDAGHVVLGNFFNTYFSAPAKPNSDPQVNLDNYKTYWATGSIASGRDWGTKRLNADGEIMGNYVHTDFPEYN